MQRNIGGTLFIRNRFCGLGPKY